MLDAGRAIGRHPTGLLRSARGLRLVNALLLAAAVAAGLAAYFVAGRKQTQAAQPTTATVERGSVLATVSASGNVQPAKTLSLGFSTSGKLVAVYVKPGEHVRKGQPLAKLDDTSQLADVRTARATLASAEANLESLLQPLTPATKRENEVAVAQAKAQIAAQQTALHDTIASTAQDRQTLQKAVTQAKAALAQTEKIAAANGKSLRTAVGEAKGAWLEAKAAAGRDQASLQAAIDQAQAQLQRDQQGLQADQQQLSTGQSDVSTYTGQVNDFTGTVNGLQSQVDGDKGQVEDDQQRQHSKHCDLPATDSKYPGAATCANLAYDLSQAQSRLSDDQSKLSDAQSSLSAAQSKLDAASNAVKSDQTAIVADQNAIATDQETIANAQNALASGQVKDAQSVNQAWRSYVNSKQSLRSGAATNTQSIENARKGVKDAIASLNAGAIKDRQSVHAARASLKSAQQSLASTEASNAQKAEPATAGALASARAQITSARASLENALSAEKQMTLRAPSAGTVATINGAVGETPGTSSSSASASSSSSSSGAGSSFVTLVDLAGPQVTANFSETDAAKIEPGQPATITVDALPSKQLAAHVVGVDTTQTVVSNVVTYGVTLLLDRTTPELKPGMTVTAAVIVGKRDGVLHVPNAAVRTVGGTSTVTVVDAKGNEQQRSVTTGLVGDDSTEIVSGLKAGDEVVVSSATAALTSTTGAGGGGGFRGGGGGVFFGRGG